MLLNFRKDKKGSAMLLLMMYLIIGFFIIFLAGSIIYSLAVEQTTIGNICREAQTKIKWKKTWTEPGESYNKHGGSSQKRMSSNLLDPPRLTREDAYEITKIVKETFSKYGYCTKDIEVIPADDDKIIVKGRVLLRTRNLLFGHGNEEYWQQFQFTCRLFKNFGVVDNLDK